MSDDPPDWVLVGQSRIGPTTPFRPWHVLSTDLVPQFGPHEGLCGVETLPVQFHGRVVATSRSGLLSLDGGYRLCNACAGRMLLDPDDIFAAQGPPLEETGMMLELSDDEAKSVLGAIYGQAKKVSDLIFECNAIMLPQTIDALVEENNRLQELRRRIEALMVRANGSVQRVQTEE